MPKRCVATRAVPVQATTSGHACRLRYGSCCGPSWCRSIASSRFRLVIRAGGLPGRRSKLMPRMPARWGTSIVGIAMTTERLRIIVDARYACDAYPGIGRVVTGMAHALAHHPDVAHMHLLTNPHRVNTHLQLPAASATITHHQVSGHPGSVREGQQVRRLANTIPADWFYTPYLRLPWGRFVARTMVTVHDAIPLQSASTPWHLRSGFRLALWLAAARASLLTTVSHDAATQITPYIWPHRPPAAHPALSAQFASGDSSRSRSSVAPRPACADTRRVGRPPRRARRRSALRWIRFR